MVSRETLLEARHITKRYDETVVLQDVTLKVERGEIICLLGPSGSGKSTLLRCIAGLETPDQGRVLLEGQDITLLPPYKRDFGMMFQHFALFPHRTVAENIAFGLKMQGISREAQAKQVEKMLELVGLTGYGPRSIFELSGGEQQRVALGRSLAPEPNLLMLDEPLGSLDRSLRERLMDELRTILKRLGVTAIYVTHDQQEAFAISDRLVLLNQGRIVQQGSPEALYRQPATPFVAGFFGLRNILPVSNANQAENGLWVVQTTLGPLQMSSEGGPTATLLVRPEAARLQREGAPNPIVGIVRERSFRGGHYRLVTEHAENITLEWEIATPERDIPMLGEPIHLALRPDAISFLAG